jgi:hypothetical protein
MRKIAVLNAAIGVLLLTTSVACARNGFDGGTKDGNPVGFDLASKSGGTIGAPKSSCLATNSCKFVEVYYLTDPPPACPTNQPGVRVTCSGNKRALPACPANAQCVTFDVRDTTAVEQDDDNNLHVWPSKYAKGLLVFSAAPPGLK